MGEALAEARQAGSRGAPPVGAIAVMNEAMVARGSHRVTKGNDPTAHAVVVALREAARKLGTAAPLGRHDLHHARALPDVRRRAARVRRRRARVRDAPNPDRRRPAGLRCSSSPRHARARAAGSHGRVGHPPRAEAEEPDGRRSSRRRLPPGPDGLAPDAGRRAASPIRALQALTGLQESAQGDSLCYPLARRGVRVVDGAALEKRCAKAPWVRIPPSPPLDPGHDPAVRPAGSYRVSRRGRLVA